MKAIRLLILLGLSAVVQAGNSLNILVYHHVSEQTPASTSVSPEQFRRHLQLLKDNNFNVVDLDQALKALKAREPIADNAVAITFDDGYRNIYDNALPLLEEFGYPATLFVATDPIDQGYSQMLSWAQLRDMQQRGMIIANHTRDHDYLVRHEALDDAWRAQMAANIEHAQQRLLEELPLPPPDWLAYPYGEFSSALQQLIAERGLIGFGQHSGGVSADSDFTALPRFAAAGIYANPATLLTKLQSRPMPVAAEEPADMLSDQLRPALTVTLRHRDDLSTSLNCFVDGNGQNAQWLQSTQFTLQSDNELGPGRHRYNCTSKSLSGNFFYWYSKPWLIQPDSGAGASHKKGR